MPFKAADRGSTAAFSADVNLAAEVAFEDVDDAIDCPVVQLFIVCFVLFSMFQLPLESN